LIYIVICFYKISYKSVDPALDGHIPKLYELIPHAQGVLGGKKHEKTSIFDIPCSEPVRHPEDLTDWIFSEMIFSPILILSKDPLFEMSY
jgi:hypothetical protein